MNELSLLPDTNPEFPATANALSEPEGLLAVGGNLSPDTLLKAYSRGIFPWYSEGEPILWWSPSPRMILDPCCFHVGRTLRKLSRSHKFTITVDRAFSDVISQCAQIKREGQNGTWITEDMAAAYCTLQSIGFAHSVEAWLDGKLVGGLYGVNIGRAFFGESMFSLVSGASKIAFASLCQQLKQWNFPLIDCQIHTPYLESFGAKMVDRQAFEDQLRYAIALPNQNNWIERWSLGASGFDGSK